MVGSLLTGPPAIGAAMGGDMATTAVAIIGLMNDGLSVDLLVDFPMKTQKVKNGRLTMIS